MRKSMGNDDYINVPLQIGGQGGAVPQMTQYSDRGDLIEKIKPEMMVEIIRQRFLGKEFINGEWKDLEELKDHKLTQVGAWDLSNLMLGVSSINISISNLSDREIKERAYRIAKSAQRMMLTNWREYGIKNTSQFYFVHEVIFSNTLAVLKQAGNGSIQELLKGTTKSNIGEAYRQPQREGAGKKIGRMLGLVGN